MIPQAEIERLRREVDLVKLVGSRGVQLKRTGRSWQGKCPFHADGKTPSLSITPSKGLWRCFGCDAAGDAIQFIELSAHVSFREAVEILQNI